MAGDAVTVVIVSRIRLYAEGLARSLGAHPRIEVLATAPVPALVRHRADVVIVDPASAGAHEVRALQQAWPGTRVVALAVRDDDADVVAWAEAGVAGIVTHDGTLEQLVDAVLSAVRDELACSPQVAAALLRRVAQAATERPAPRTFELTAREQEIAELLGAGLSNKEIAARLYLGLSTVKHHVHHVLRKLDAGSRSEAVARLHETGALTRPTV